MRLKCLTELVHLPSLDGAPKQILDQRLRQPQVGVKSAEDEGVPVQTNELIQPWDSRSSIACWLKTRTTVPAYRAIPLELSTPPYSRPLSTLVCGASSGRGKSLAFWL